MALTDSQTERDRLPLHSAMSLSAVLAGLVAVAVSYAGPLLVVLEAAKSAGLTGAQTTSWVWAVSIASGLVCTVLSLATRQPVMVAWSVPGAALLLTALGNYSYAEAIGAYIVAGALGAVLGISGLFGRLLAAVPKPILAAVLAGILLPFVVGAAGAVMASPLVAGGLVLAYLAGKRFLPRYAVFVALAAGTVLGIASGEIAAPRLALSLSGPLWTAPEFSLTAIMGISVPLLIVTMAGQNGPGLAMMLSSGYRPNDRLLLGASGVMSVLFAPFGSHAINLAAITAGICSGPEAHEDPRRRYVAGMACGVFYLVFGTFSAAVVSLFAAVPGPMLTALAGVALLGALQGAVRDAVTAEHASPAVLEAALITLVVTASGVEPLGIVSPFWGCLAGAAALLLLRRRRP
ncbi:benzoate transporter [Arthrobacter crystallopoietes BAB-32]|uniref:Benzoate transporter n=1 Tax=Arthrobacter crystallopoietes BAB-32 TaxID=1246476 RepID=N1V495_9MICC|nr:benzoate/H(+) symporter BenE family transporter [Arthrobacter crystallopoietes]EMY34887.1 benzoate transporter [Arthrobacter crystallopoietes BAB-32]